MKHAKYIFIALITLCIILTYFASEVYLPALPMLQHWLGCTTAQLQLSVSFFIFGVAISQIIGGPLIDRFSYRHVAILMTLIFILSSLACALSVNLNMLIAARLFQAFSSGILAIIGRATLPRKFSAEETMRIYLFVSPILALSLSFSPVIGGYLTYFWEWSSVFYFSALVGLLFLALAYKFLFVHQEKASIISLSPRSIIKTYSSLLKDKSYLGAIFILSAVFAQNFSYLTETPFIFGKLNYTSSQIGKFYILISIAFIIGSLITKKIMPSCSYKKLVFIGFAIDFTSILLMLAISLYGINSAYQIYLPSSLIGIGNGILIPVVTGRALSLFPKSAGYASGMLSSITLLASAVATSVIHNLTHGSVTLLAIFMLVVLFAGLFFFIVVSPKPLKVLSTTAS